MDHSTRGGILNVKLETVLSVIGMQGRGDVFADWQEAEESRPCGEVPFLTESFVRWACGEAYLTEDMTQAAVSAARRVAGDEALASFAWYCHDRLFRHDARKINLGRWPDLTQALDRDAGMFYVLVLLSGTPQLQEIHRQRCIPPEDVRDTMLDLKRCLETENYRKRFGAWGISPFILSWLLHHWRAELYRLGRLQFIHTPMRGRIRAFRHKQTGLVVALSEAGVRFRADGQVDGTGDVIDRTSAWTSTLTITEKEIVGFPIHPLGAAVRHELALLRSDWTQELAPGDPVLDMHIPTGEPMTYDACGESIRRAMEFYPKYFPDKPFVGFTCYSWILDDQFERLLPPTSNLVRFEKEVYLFPISFPGRGPLETVFGFKPDDIREAPRKTTMQRAFAEHIEKGGHFHGGGCFLLAKDFNWGTHFYRRRNFPWPWFNPPCVDPGRPAK